MKKSGDIWLPDEDSYFSKFFEDGTGFQLDRLEGALEHITDWGVAVDGGAHVGSWSIVMAEMFGAVHAFEPASDTYECLQANTVGRINIHLYNKALGDRETMVNSMDDMSRLGNTGSRFVAINEAGSVEMTTIDGLNLAELGFLKLDLEGAEILALRGAERTLLRCRPVVYVEAKKGMAGRFGEADKASLEYMRKLGALQVAKFGSDYIFTFDK